MRGVVLIRLEGMQSWCVEPAFPTRASGREPSKSGVVGLVAACLGIRRGDDAAVARLAAGALAVRVDLPGTLEPDFYTAGGGRAPADPRVAGTAGVVGYGTSNAVGTRWYIHDASFLAGLEVDDADAVAAALRHPVFAPYLGRASCPPCYPLLEGVCHGTALEAVSSRPVPRRLVERVPGVELPLRVVYDAFDGIPRPDHPISFRQLHHRYGMRCVAETYVDPPLEER